MSSDIELDDIQVVNVTGKAHKDKPRKRESKCTCWRPSLRVRMLLLYSACGAAYCIGAVVLVTQLRISLIELDRQALEKSISRFTALLYDDIGRLVPYTRHAAWQKVTADAAVEVASGRKNGPAIKTFIQRYLNTSVVYDENGTSTHVYRCDSLVNYWGIVEPENFAVVWSQYHAGKNGTFCSLAPANPWDMQPVFPAAFLMGMINSKRNPEEGWVSVYRTARLVTPVCVSIEAIMIPNENGTITDKTVYGYLLAAKIIEPHLSTFASNVPGCITQMSTDDEDSHYFSESELELWNATEAGTFAEDKSFTGTPNFTLTDIETLKKCPIRHCPAIPLFHDTELMMTGYFKLCGLDPKVTTRTTCIKYRMDRPLSRVEEGQYSVILLSVLVVVLMIAIFTLFVAFLDFAVLRRVVKLSKTIHAQTLKHDEGFKELDEKKNKKDKDASAGRSGGDEIKNLKFAVEQNNYRLRRRVEDVNDVLKTERQRVVRHKQAMQLLSLWCDRKEFFPGLRPNAVLYRFEPTRKLDDLLSNPIAVEYLKSHCESDCTLENLFFLLDVSWLSELEYGEDQEEDAEKRKQIHQIASSTASTIVARYIAEDAPQQINISANSFKRLREKGHSYKRGMFDEAVGEVKLMLNTDILPRFQSTNTYTAMSENVYIDSFAFEDDDDLSSDSESTAGSVLSDGSNPAAAQVVGFNFRNLYASFEGDTDLGSTCTNELSLIDDHATNSSANHTDNQTNDTKSSSSIKLRSDEASDAESMHSSKQIVPEKKVIGSKPISPSGSANESESSESSSTPSTSSSSSD